jgi:hypothetical protein
MIDRFEIIDHDSPRPKAERILFCDGTEERLFRAETDMELSHWRPNRTPAEYRAGTSTEICCRFLDNPRPGAWTAAVNNHVDVDGILSVYLSTSSPWPSPGTTMHERRMCLSSMRRFHPRRCYGRRGEPAGTPNGCASFR